MATHTIKRIGFDLARVGLLLLAIAVVLIGYSIVQLFHGRPHLVVDLGRDRRRALRVVGDP